MERRILKTLSYRVPLNSLFEETNILLVDLFNKQQEKLEEYEIESLKEIISFITKLTIHDYTIGYLPYEITTISVLEIALSMA